MREKLLKLLDNIYAVYSNFPVAAIVVMNDGREFCGVNVENASYGATICAERSAIVSAISAGYKRHDFKELYIMTKSVKVSTCCFICRQVISEMFNEDAKVVCMNEKDEDEYKVRDLCVYPFLDEDLK